MSNHEPLPPEILVDALHDRVAPASGKLITDVPIPWDDAEADATDGAHPAWWRGCDHGVMMTCKVLAEAFSSEPAYGDTELARLARRIWHCAGCPRR